MSSMLQSLVRNVVVMGGAVAMAVLMLLADLPLAPLAAPLAEAAADSICFGTSGQTAASCSGAGDTTTMSAPVGKVLDVSTINSGGGNLKNQNISAFLQLCTNVSTCPSTNPLIGTTFTSGSSTSSSCVAQSGFVQDCLLTVPNVTAGVYSLTITDGQTGGNDTITSSTAILTVSTPSLSLSGTSTCSTFACGPVGSTLTASGSNWKVSSTVTVTAGAASASCATTTGGALTGCNITVQPTTSTGTNLTLTATDGVNPQTATYQVQAPVITLAAGTGSNCTSNACSGPVGSTFTVTGSNFAIETAGASVFISLAGVSTTCTASNSTGALPASGACSLTVPSAAFVSGGYTVTADDGVNAASSDGTNTAKFTITSSISSLPSSATSGTNIVVSGTGFAAGASISFQLGSTPASSTCSADAAGSFDCSVLVPSVPSGSQALQVSDGTNTVLLSGGFTVQTGAQAGSPTVMIVSKISPNFGPSSGGTKKNPTTTPPTGTTATNAIAITGSGFGVVTGVTFGSNAVPAGSWSVNAGGTVIKAIPPACATCGAVQVQIQGSLPGGGGVASDVSTAVSLYFYGPMVTAISPNFGAAVGGNTISIKGHNFSGNATTASFVAASGQASVPTFSGSLTPCSSLSADSCLKMTMPSGLTPGGGAYYISISGSHGASDILSQQSLFTTELYSFGPVVASIGPTFGPATGLTKLTIHGHGFTGATQVSVGSNHITSGSFTITGDTTITISSLPAQFSTDPAQVNVVVLGQHGDVSPNVPKDLYSYGPMVLSVSPKSGGTGASFTKITITGKNFTGATQVIFGTISVSSSNFTVNSTGTAITLTSVPALPSGQTTGARYVTVVGANGPTDVSAINTKAVFNIL